MADMRRLTYTPSRFGSDPISLSVLDMHAGAAYELRGYSWDYALQGRSIINQTIKPKDAQTALCSANRKEFMRLVHEGTRDMQTGNPGTFTFGDAYKQTGFITGFDPESYNGHDLTGALHILLLDGVWRRERYKSFSIDPNAGSSGLNYPYDYPFDFGAAPTAASIINESIVPSDIKLVISGPCTNPSITIGNNMYEVKANVPAGAQLIVDAVGAKRSIVMINERGETFDYFKSGTRGDGRDKGRYIFQPLAPGKSSVSWAGTYPFTVFWYEEEVLPPWI